VTTFAVGSLVRARGREWVVLPDSQDGLLVLRPLGGGEDDIAGVLPELEPVEPATSATRPAPGCCEAHSGSASALLAGRSAQWLASRSPRVPTNSSRC
jgi:hypothetical protein